MLKLLLWIAKQILIMAKQYLDKQEEIRVFQEKQANTPERLADNDVQKVTNAALNSDVTALMYEFERLRARAGAITAGPAGDTAGGDSDSRGSGDFGAG